VNPSQQVRPGLIYQCNARRKAVQNRKGNNMFDSGIVKAGLMAAAMVSAIALAPAASAALVNGSFEAPNASNGDVLGSAGWGHFNNVYTSSNNFKPGGSFVNPTALDGTQVVKQYGVDAGMFQDMAAAAGDKVDASVYAMNWNGDNFNNIFLLQIFALDAGGNNISGGFTPLAQVAAGSDAIVGGSFDYVLSGTNGGNDFDWTQMVVSAIMPVGTASTRIQLIHILEASTSNGGAIFLDNASLTVSQVPVPAAAWLFGSALLGLMGMARRRKS
jgi:hypothetical protein